MSFIFAILVTGLCMRKEKAWNNKAFSYKTRVEVLDSPRKLFNTSTLVQMERGNNSDVFQSVDPVSTTIFCFFGAALFCTVLKRLRIVRLENFFLCSALMLTQKGKGAGGSQWTAGILSFDNILSYVIWKFKRFPLPPSTRQPHGSFRPTGLPGFRGSIRLNW